MSNGLQVMCEGLVWLIGVVVCLLAANHMLSCSLIWAMDGCIVRCGIISSCQSAATSEIIKHFWSRVFHICSITKVLAKLYILIRRCSHCFSFVSVSGTCVQSKCLQTSCAQLTFRSKPESWSLWENLSIATLSASLPLNKRSVSCHVRKSSYCFSASCLFIFSLAEPERGSVWYVLLCGSVAVTFYPSIKSPTQPQRPRTQVSLNLESRDLDRWNLRSMLKISYAACLGPSVVNLAQLKVHGHGQTRLRNFCRFKLDIQPRIYNMSIWAS